MSTLAQAEQGESRVASKRPPSPYAWLLRAAPHVLVWTLLLVPTIRTMARGWRPLADDASIGIWAWRSLSLHPPLVGQFTAGTGVPASNPGPLEFWLLGPFAHVDPGQGILIGSAILCAAVLSVTLLVLSRNAGIWAAVVFSIAVVDLAITSPTPFVDPVWNSSFGFFWFAAFLGIAFVVGLGNLRYVPLLLFVGSVAVDSHLMYLPPVGILLIAATICGWLIRKPPDRRWLWWTGGVALLCWAAPLAQQFFGARPNISLLLQYTGQKTEGWVFGLRALGRAASPIPIWTSPRPIDPPQAASGIAHANPLLALVLLLLICVAVLAWRGKRPVVVSMCVVSLGGAFGVVALFAHFPASYELALIWANLAVWLVGVCIWMTLGLALVTVVRSRYRDLTPSPLAVKTRERGVVAGLGAACVAGTMVAAFPYGNQAVQDWSGVPRVERMVADIEHHVPKGRVSIGIDYSGPDPFYQRIRDEHGTAYRLLTDGWILGMSPVSNTLLGMPVHPESPFVIFTEHGAKLTAAHFYPHYWDLWPPP